MVRSFVIREQLFELNNASIVRRYEIVDSYRQTTETYLPLRLENYPREVWDNFKNFFKSDDKAEEIDDDDP